MKTIFTLFLFSLLVSQFAFATKVPARSCTPPSCNKDDVQLKSGDGAALISCAAVNGYGKDIPVSFDPNCGSCLAVACDQARLVDDEIRLNEERIKANTQPVSNSKEAE